MLRGGTFKPRTSPYSFQGLGAPGLKLLAAEYLLPAGNSDVVLCERSIRTSESTPRNTLDIAAIPVLQERTHLPVIADPSHACGVARLVALLSRAALAAASFPLRKSVD